MFGVIHGGLSKEQSSKWKTVMWWQATCHASRNGKDASRKHYRVMQGGLIKGRNSDVIINNLSSCRSGSMNRLSSNPLRTEKVLMTCLASTAEIDSWVSPGAIFWTGRLIRDLPLHYGMSRVTEQTWSSMHKHHYIHPPKTTVAHVQVYK